MRLFAAIALAWLTFSAQAQAQAVTPADLDLLLLGASTDGVGMIPMDPFSTYDSIKLAVAGTPYEGRVSVNALHEPSMLNVYIIDSEWPSLKGNPHLARFRMNACSLEHLSAIVVDFRLIHELWASYFADDESWGSRSALLYWVIAHEVGHLQNHHGVSHFDRTPFASPAGCEEEAREYAADNYLLEVALRTNGNLVRICNSMFTRILSMDRARVPSRLRARIRPSDVARGRIENSCERPAYVLRAHRFLLGLSKRQGVPVSAETEALTQELGATK